MVGTGKYRDNETMARAIEAAGADVVTVAVRRVDLDRSKETGSCTTSIRPLLPAREHRGCFTADDAVRYARLAREAGFNEFVKLEVIGDQETLLPDVQGCWTRRARWSRTASRCWPIRTKISSPRCASRTRAAPP